MMNNFNLETKLSHLGMTKKEYWDLYNLCKLNQDKDELIKGSPRYWIEKFNCEVISETDATIIFLFRGSECKYFKNSKWCNGRSLVDGRNLSWLLTQLKWWSKKL